MTTNTHQRLRHPAIGRAITVAAGAAGALLLWSVHSWSGTELAVITAALVAGAAAWALLTLLERTARRPARTFRIIASAVLLLSLAGPMAGTGLGGRLALLGLHLTVGAALIIGLPARNRC